MRNGMRMLERLDSRRPSSLRVLTYHRIESEAGFRDQIAHLVAHYNPVNEDAVVKAVLEGADLPPRAVLVTFDDADCDFGDIAWPILRAANVPVILFVPTAYPDQADRRFWWDELIDAVNETEKEALIIDGLRIALSSPAEKRDAIRTLKGRVQQLEPAEIPAWIHDLRENAAVGESPPRVHSWEALRQLAAEGVSIGAHTRTHPFLDRLPAAELEEEIAGSVRELTEQLGRVPRSFAYPNGRTSPAAIEAVRAAGLALAFTTERGPNDTRNARPLELRRINVGPRVGAGALQARLIQSSPRFSRTNLEPAR